MDRYHKRFVSKSGMRLEDDRALAENKRRLKDGKRPWWPTVTNPVTFQEFEPTRSYLNQAIRTTRRYDIPGDLFNKVPEVETVLEAIRQRRPVGRAATPLQNSNAARNMLKIPILSREARDTNGLLPNNYPLDDWLTNSSRVGGDTIKKYDGRTGVYVRNYQEKTAFKAWMDKLFLQGSYNTEKSDDDFATTLPMLLSHEHKDVIVKVYHLTKTDSSGRKAIDPVMLEEAMNDAKAHAYLQSADCVAIKNCATRLCSRKHVPKLYFAAMAADSYHPEELFYIIMMEKVGVVSLQEYATRQKIPFTTNVYRGKNKLSPETYIQLERAVASLWVNGIMHVDLHPDNILYDPRAKTFFIIDFGFAVYLGPQATQAIRDKISKAMQANVPLHTMTNVTKNQERNVYVRNMLQVPNVMTRLRGYPYYNPDYVVLKIFDVTAGLDNYQALPYYTQRRTAWGYIPPSLRARNNRDKGKGKALPETNTAPGLRTGTPGRAFDPNLAGPSDYMRAGANRRPNNARQRPSTTRGRKTLVPLPVIPENNNNNRGPPGNNGNGGGGGGGPPDNNNNNNMNNGGNLNDLREYLAGIDASNFAAPANAAPTTDNQIVGRLGRMAKMNAHGFGLVIREIPNAINKVLELGWTLSAEQWRKLLHIVHRVSVGDQAMPDQVRAELVAFGVRGAPATIVKRFYFADKIRQDLQDAIHRRTVCKDPLQRRYARLYAVGGANKTDTVSFVGYKLVRAENAAPGTPRLRFRAVALGSYSTAAHRVTVVADELASRSAVNGEVDLSFSGNGAAQRNQWLREKRVAELDVMCSSSPGAGPALMSYILARIALRKKGGTRRFKGVVTYFAAKPDGHMPLLKTAQGFGFTQVGVTMRQGRLQTTRTVPYYGSFDTDGQTWVKRTVDSMHDGVFTGLEACPTVQGSGRTYCA